MKKQKSDFELREELDRELSIDEQAYRDLYRQLDEEEQDSIEEK